METALIIAVPEAEALVGRFRDRHDPSDTAGCPAHVTLLYPFKPPHDIDADVLAGLRRCLAGLAPFPFSLVGMRRFPGVLYLAPEPAEPFRQLTLALWERHPETPPYGGRHPNIVPHLSVAQLADEMRLDQVAEQFARASDGHLPVTATAEAVTLIERTAERWQVRDMLRLGSG